MGNSINSFIEYSSSLKKFRVNITETLELAVEVKERKSAGGRTNSKYVLTGDNFTGLGFVANLLRR